MKQLIYYMFIVCLAIIGVGVAYFIKDTVCHFEGMNYSIVIGQCIERK